MFAVILIFCGNRDPREHITKGRTRIIAKGRACVCVAAPIDIGFGKIGSVLPVVLINQWQDACAIGTGLGAKDTIVSVFIARLHIVSRICVVCAISLDMSSNIVLLW